MRELRAVRWAVLAWAAATGLAAIRGGHAARAALAVVCGCHLAAFVALGREGP